MKTIPATVAFLMGCTGTMTDTTDGGPTGTTDGNQTTDIGTTDGMTDSTDTGTPEGPVYGLRWETNKDFSGPFTVTWSQESAGTAYVEYQVDGTWLRTPDIDAEAGENSTPVLGIPLGDSSPYKVTVVGLATIDGSDEMVEDRLPTNFPTATVSVNDDTRWTDDYVLIPVARGFSNGWVALFDRQGRTVWAARTGLVRYSQILDSGDAFVWADSTRNAARRAHLDQRIERLDVNGQYHTFVELSDGTVSWHNNAGIVELASGSTSPATVSNTYFGYVNGLTYAAADDAYVVSEFTQSVTAVDRKTGDVIWEAPSTTAKGAFEYSFVPTDSQFINQHGVEMLDNGNLLVSTELDNDPVAKPGQPPYYYGSGPAGIREYEVDQVKKELRLVWEFDPSIDTAASYSWVHRLDNGNTVHTVEQNSTVYEVTSDKNVAWRVDFAGAFTIGRAVVIDDLYDFVGPAPKPAE